MKKDLFYTLLSIAAIVLLGFSVYGNCLGGEFILDDEALVRDNLSIKRWSNIPKIFSEDIAASVETGSTFYRPLQMLTYMFDYSLWRLDPKGYHLSNVLLHILVSLSLFWLINMLYNNRLLSLLASLFFLSHPIHTEAVAYISGRADPLACLFMLLSFIFYIRYLRKENMASFLLIIISYVLSLLSRENSLILPLILLLYHYIFKEKIRLKPFLSVLSLTAFYIIIRFTLLRFLLAGGVYHTRLYQRIPGFLVALASYIRLLFAPFDLHMEYTNQIFYLDNPLAVAGGIFLGLSFIYVKRRRTGRSLYLFSLLWFFIALMPVSNLYPINAYMAEHWLYVPAIGFFLVLARIFERAIANKKYRIVAIVLCLALLGFYSSLTARQNRYWQSAFNFYQKTLEHTQGTSRIYNNLGMVLAKAGEHQKAIAAYEKAIAIKSDSAKIHNNLGLSYYHLRRIDQALASFNKAIELDPDYARAYNNLGLTYSAINAEKQAVAAFKKAIQISPGLAEAYNNLGLAYGVLNKKEEAVELFKKAIFLNPDYGDAYNNLANIYSALGEDELAQEIFKKAISTSPSLAQAHYNLGNQYREQARHKEALAEYKKAIAIDPGFAKAYNNMGLSFYMLGDKENAISSLKKAAQLDPALVEAYNNIGNFYSAQGKHLEAIEQYKKAIAADPKQADAYYNLANMYVRLGEDQLAIENYKKAVECRPDYAAAYNNLGNRYRSLGKNDQAIQAYLKAIEADPNLAQAYYNVAVGYYRQQRYEEAIAYCDKAEELGYANKRLLELLTPYRKNNE